MNVSSRKRLFVSAVAIVGLIIIAGQTSAFAQPTLKQQVFNGGYFQVIDVAEAPCTGQCAIATDPDIKNESWGRVVIDSYA